MAATTITQPKPPDWSDPLNLEAYSWCINHGITIGCLACVPGNRNRDWDIEITVNGEKKMSPRSYNVDELYEKVFELYKFYYGKRTIL